MLANDTDGRLEFFGLSAAGALIIGNAAIGIAAVGVIGLGRLGQRVAEIGRAFGMKVVTWSQNLDPDVAKKAHVKPVSKEELFSSSDVVTVHYKLSERSRGLIGHEELSWMKETAYLVNTSRGPLIDTEALTSRPASRARLRISSDSIELTEAA